MNQPGEQPSDVPVRFRRDLRAWLQTVLAIPSAVLPLLPSFSCPVCIAAYAGVLSSLGLGVVLSDRVQRPLIVFFLTVTLGSVAWTAIQRGRFGPLGTVLSGCLAIVAGRIVWNIPWTVYLGVALLVGGALWNLLLRRPRVTFVPLRSEPRAGAAG